jgi:polyisoprenoid-binding protein YceI
LLLGAAVTPVAAATASYIVASGAPSQVVFQSKAPMETFTGKTHQLTGAIELDPEKLADVIVVRLEADMASLDTGIALRDRHMRDNHLHCDKFPKAVFTGGTLSDVSAPQVVEGTPVTGTITGELELHGVKKPLAAKFEMSMTGGVLRVVARFGVTLAEFGIPRPQFLLMKLGETQAVTVDLVAKTQ